MESLFRAFLDSVRGELGQIIPPVGDTAGRGHALPILSDSACPVTLPTLPVLLLPTCPVTTVTTTE